jgi:hypothetical protein
MGCLYSASNELKHADSTITAAALERLAAHREDLSENQLKKDPLNPIYLAIEVRLRYTARLRVPICGWD